MDHARVAQDVLTYVGGADNINAAAHCATRLRLVLNDMDKVDQKALDKDPDLKGTFVAGGMFQIIVGPGDVDLVFDEMVKTGGVKEVSKDEAKQEAAKSGNIFSRFIKMIADIFVPILPALIAGGLMMAINNVLTAEGLFGDQALVKRFIWLDDYAQLINMISSAAFAFLPVLVGYSATKRFGGNVYLGAAMGAAMVSTSLLSAYNMADEAAAQAFWDYMGTSDTWSLFGLTVDKIGYQAMVIPVLCVAWILSTIEKWLHKRLSGTADFLLTPLITMLVTGFLTFVLVGPITRQLSLWITEGLDWTYNTLGPIGGFLFGLVYSPIVVTGLHQSFPAVEIPLLPVNGGVGDFIFPIASMANVAQGAVALAVFFNTRDAKMKGLAGAGGVSAVFGITEPAIFGVNLRLRWPFYIAMGAAAIGGAGVALFNVRGAALGAAGFVGFVSIITSNIPTYLMLEAMTFVIAFAAAFIYGRTPKGQASFAADDEVDEAALEAEATKAHAATVELPAEAATDFTVTAPIQGKAVPLSEVQDQTFASGMLGPGLAVVPDSGPVVSPVDGEVLVAFPTGHAYGLRSASGVELLIHVGMDTVELDGKHFSPKVSAGDKVLRGQPLVDVDWDGVTAAGYQTVTPIVVSNATAFGGLADEHTGEVARGDALYAVVPAEQPAEQGASA
ncbi:sucrose-specific PTS transporter subunit IIBC [Actinomyces sp. MRS3W]|uniref:sucrose-specific PTS transporter subunit IIBC n=1 Tax=Actinomyces sp. MRS3W TaxID=2800796 RepID=UPI0028FD88E7|nr:sucrose-specific PTS transporter subunit IIBC [Actinomyces sp. MRS3W]MDU0348966.1 sucrose-specific PTS transporter subunit IIBC [Actinomyces sp. MRS3W]